VRKGENPKRQIPLLALYDTVISSAKASPNKV
jgi:hypothetical protein